MTQASIELTRAGRDNPIVEEDNDMLNYVDRVPAKISLLRRLYLLNLFL